VGLGKKPSGGPPNNTKKEIWEGGGGGKLLGAIKKGGRKPLKRTEVKRSQGSRSWGWGEKQRLGEKGTATPRKKNSKN